MKLGFSQGNNGNGKLVLTADNLKFACAELGISDDAHTLRRAARAFDLYHSGKVEHVNDHTFRVASQYDRQEPYEVKIKQTPYLKAGGYAYCTCQDWMNYSGDQDLPDVNFWCKHSIAALVWLHNNNGRKRIANECGSVEAKQLQNKLNGQFNSQNNNGNGAQKAPSNSEIDPSAKIFLESDQLDEAQILTGEGSKAHKLSDGSYCISYLGICNLADKFGILAETLADYPKVGCVTVRAMRNDTKNGRKSIQPVNGSFEIAEGKAKRNAIRMLLPVAEIKAIEHKAKLESEFSWQVAYDKCSELVGGKAQCDIVINDLVKAGKLRQAASFEYNRTEWLMIHAACKQDANDGGDNTPSSNDDDGSNPNWRDWYDKCVKVSSMYDTSIVINQVMNDHNAQYRKDQIGDDDWESIFQECKKRREDYDRVQAAKSERAHLMKMYEVDYVRRKTGFDKVAHTLAKCESDTVFEQIQTVDAFLNECKSKTEAITETTGDANEQPLQNNGNGERKVMMDKKLNVWIIEADGTKTKTSCREIAEQYDSYEKGIIKRLRAGIDSGADISSVELN